MKNITKSMVLALILSFVAVGVADAKGSGHGGHSKGGKKPHVHKIK